MEFFNSLVHWIVAAVFGLAAWIALSAGSITPQVVSQTPIASSTAQVSTAPVVQKIATTSPKTATTTPKIISAPAATTTKATKTVVATLPPVQSPPVVTAPAPANITNEMIASTNAEARASVVNIFCTLRTANTASYISGSGVVIDPRGIILTNAHIGQFFLLQDNPGSTHSSCIIRTGSPATPAYNAVLMYINPTWINANASQILSDNAVGTGEDDYAFLYIIGPTQFAPALTSSFASLSYSVINPIKNEPLLLAAYPAAFLDSTSVQRSLYPTSAVTKVQDVYTFQSSNNIDLISLGGTAVAQGGSSGGAAIDLADDKLLGLISTESDGATTASRDLRAITLAYINRSLQTSGLGGIAALLSGDLAQKVQDFKTNASPALTNKLLDAIEK